MKKALSLILAFLMVASMFVILPITATAGEFTTIASLAEITDLAGDYALGADITANTATVSGTFTGTLDGNGKTITTSVPLFEQLNGTVMDLTIAGTIDRSTVTADTGALANCAKSAIVRNVENNANIIGSPTGYTANYGDGALNASAASIDDVYRLAGTGGLIGSATGNCEFKDCSNNGNITGLCTAGIVGIYGYDVTGNTVFTGCSNAGEITDAGASEPSTTATDANYFNPAGENYSSGGIVGFIYDAGTITFDTCVNAGVITATGMSKAPAGGMFGEATVHNYVNPENNTKTVFTYATITVKDCVNSANVTGSGQTGGLVGWGGYSATIIDNCSNSGAVESTASYAGGIVGRPGQKENETIVKNCINAATGSVKSSKSQVGGIIGYSDVNGLKIYNCINYADISTTVSDMRGAGIIGSCGAPNFEIVNCTNEGDITAVNTTGGIVSYTTQKGGLISGCINKGNINGTDGQTGGILGYAQKSITVENCLNDAGTVVKSGTSYAGGVVGRFCQDITTTYTSDVVGTFEIRNCVNKGDVISNYTSGLGNCGGIIAYTRRDVAIYNCINYGKIESYNVSGGIAGYLGSGDKYTGENTVYGCMNFGEVLSYHREETSKKSSDYSSGIVGYSFSSGTNKYINMTYCGNAGNVTSVARACGLLGYTNASSSLTVKNCYNIGSLATTSGTGAVYSGGYNNGAFVIENSNNYFTDVNENAWYENSTDVALTTDETIDKNELSNGALTVKLNADKVVFHQTLGEDDNPTTDAASKDVVVINSSYKNLTIRTADAASIRLTENSTGMRFITDINRDDYNALVTAYGAENVTVGTIITPTAYVTAAGGYTFEKLDAYSAANENKTAYLNVVRQAKTFDGIETTTDNYQARGSIANIKTGHYALDFTAVGYIKVVDGANTMYFYSTTTAARTVKDVATAALADTSVTYTEAQTAILNAYAGNN